MVSVKAEKLIRLFLMDEAHMLVYNYRRKKDTYKIDKPALDELIKEGLIKQVTKTNKEIIFQYIIEEKKKATKSVLKSEKSKTLKSKKELIPLHTIQDGRYFRLPGQRKKFRKRDNNRSIPVQNRLEDGTPVVDYKNGCMCEDSSGRTSVKDWYLMVEEAE